MTTEDVLWTKRSVLDGVTKQYGAQVRQQLSKYKHKNLAQEDVISVFASFSELMQTKVEEYAFEDGSVKDLFCLIGCIPVNFQGAIYDIPVRIILMDTHPYKAPMCYVCPPKNMQIKPSNHVDANGKIDLPYLQEWEYPKSDLEGLVAVMIVVFGEASPVFTKQREAPGPQFSSAGSKNLQKRVAQRPTSSDYIMRQLDAQLRQQLSKYKHKDLAKQDVMKVLVSFSDWNPKIEKYAFNNGLVKDLLCIDGNIPVHYKGARYNIPICIYTMDTHPYRPPMCFVRPTKDMLIKPSKHVDANGRIYLPYLHEWKYPKSDLMGLIQVMSAVFGEASPVYAKAAPPRPQYPPGGSPHAQQNVPYPTNQGFMPMPSSSFFPTQNPPTSTYQGPGYSYPVAKPVYPPSTTAYPYNQNPSQGYPSNSQAQTSAAKPVSKQSSLPDDQIKASILSAVEDKLKHRRREVLAEMTNELHVLTATQMKLKEGQQTLERMTNDLEKEQLEVEENIKLLERKDEEVQIVLNKMEGQEEIDIDEVVVATAPLYKQLLNLFAEENAIEDTMYYLSEALRKNVIETEVFLKHVRELSRRQYVVRALMQKARAKAGLTVH